MGSRLEALLKTRPVNESQKQCLSSPKSLLNNDFGLKSSQFQSRLPRPVVKNLALDLTQLWSESHAESAVLGPNNKNPQNSEDREKAGKRYRSSIRIMVRPEVVERLQRPVRANSSDFFAEFCQFEF